MRAFVEQGRNPPKAIPPEVGERLRSTLPDLLRERPVALVYLYGSVARGQTTPFSDVDLALVLDQPLSRREQFGLELSLQAEIEEACDLPEADVRVINQAPLMIQGTVVTQGQLLYCRQESQRIHFETTVRQGYFDYQPVAQRMQHQFFERIRRKDWDMVDKDTIQGIVGNLESYVKKLRELATCSWDEFQGDFRNIESAKHLLQVSIGCCLDLANHIIAAEGWRSPQDYFDSFRVLNEQGLISTEFLSTLRQMVSLRNRLVHLYWQVDEEVLYRILQEDLGDFDRFVRDVLRGLDLPEE